ncbi:MAG: tetratricopeptide repeat protein [Planctomycetota bacterium]
MGRLSADEFLAAVTPALDAGNVESLRDEVNRRWAASELCGLLRHTDVDVRRTAVVTLGIVGDRGIVGCLTRSLHDSDEQVHQFAEDALWSIWFRGGKPAAAAEFREASIAMAEDRFEEAGAAFEHATELDPDFAEAHNQLAIVRYLQHDWAASMESCRRTLALMPTHFGAMGGLGHGHAHLGQLPQAIDCYRRALAINPNMPKIADAKARLEARLDRDEAGASEAAVVRATEHLDFGDDLRTGG